MRINKGAERGGVEYRYITPQMLKSQTWSCHPPSFLLVAGDAAGETSSTSALYDAPPLSIFSSRSVRGAHDKASVVLDTSISRSEIPDFQLPATMFDKGGWGWFENDACMGCPVEDVPAGIAPAVLMCSRALVRARVERISDGLKELSSSAGCDWTLGASAWGSKLVVERSAGSRRWELARDGRDSVCNALRRAEGLHLKDVNHIDEDWWWGKTKRVSEWNGKQRWPVGGWGNKMDSKCILLSAIILALHHKQLRAIS